MNFFPIPWLLFLLFDWNDNQKGGDQYSNG